MRRRPGAIERLRASYVLVVLDGRVGFPQRFAVDWVRMADDVTFFRGDAAINDNWHGHGEPVYAATAGTVVLTQDGIPENIPLSGGTAIPIDRQTAAGNYVVVDENGRYTLYAHLQPESLMVRPGDIVRPGDLLGRIGKSGNSLAPHLHFHISDAPGPLTGDGLPFMIDRFELLGRLENLQAVLGGVAWSPDPARPPRMVTRETPLENMVIGVE